MRDRLRCAGWPRILLPGATLAPGWQVGLRERWVTLQAGRQAGNGMACSRSQGATELVSQGQRRGRCKVRRRAERVIVPPVRRPAAWEHPEGQGDHPVRFLPSFQSTPSSGPGYAPSPGPTDQPGAAGGEAPPTACGSSIRAPSPYLRSRMAFTPTSAYRR